jgi:prepilin-type N-terminal cleavage/methylation domain-containing protein
MLRPDTRTNRNGLTLIEVMVALGVLVILVGGIFLVVQTTLKTVLEIDNNASREDEVTNLIDILRGGFRDLPSRARIAAEPATEGSVDQYLIVVRDAPGFLTWLAQPEADDMIVLLSLRQDDADSGWRVCLKRFAPPESFSEHDLNPKNLLRAGARMPWLELVGDFKKLGARFYDGTTRKWKDEWKDEPTRPALIELTVIYEHAKDARSERPVLWVPPVIAGATS